MKTILCFCAGCLFLSIGFAQGTKSIDGDWADRKVTLKNTPEAAFMFRIGDVDNLGFGWASGFNPFCGATQEEHPFPWEADPEETAGFDRILTSSNLSSNYEEACGADEYFESIKSLGTKPAPFVIDITPLAGIKIENALLQIFVDGFQSASYCSRFQVKLNEQRFVEAERVLNAIHQSRPTGKLISIPIPEGYFPLLSGSKFVLQIDEALGLKDAWAIDFIKLTVNRKPITNCVGSTRGFVVEKGTLAPIQGALVDLPDGTTAETDGDGGFTIKNVPAGFVAISASKTGFLSGIGFGDVAAGTENPDLFIELEPTGVNATMNGKIILAGSSILLENIRFEPGSSTLNTEAKNELGKLVQFLKDNQMVEIELSGHASNEGEAKINKSLSYQRALACKTYLLGNGIETGRVIVVGRGSELPLTSDDTEENPALYQRIEVRFLKL